MAFFCAFLFVGLLLSSVPAARAQSPQVQTNTPDTSRTDLHPVLVELFTSEGCSTCPPADALLAKIDAGQPIAGAQLIVLSEHVDYWDHDGWKDPNSSAQLTERQNSYEQVLKRESPFTPQLIVDGTTSPHINDPGGIGDALRKAAAAPKIPVRIGEVAVDPGIPAVLRVHVETDADSDSRSADVFVAVAFNRVESQVLKGENGGKHLVHVAVVNQLIKIGKLPKGKSFSADVRVKLTPGTDPKNLRLIAFVQEPGPGKLLGAALHLLQTETSQHSQNLLHP
ncbi:MAG: DUF1223 domain-containing protein [Candidatus Sulfotelmatobacter sp.]|jgi:hypothetical protein